VLAEQRRVELERALAVAAQPGGEDVAEADEAIEQRPVPGDDRFGVGGGGVVMADSLPDPPSTGRQAGVNTIPAPPDWSEGEAECLKP
jgi:hypothetical protein